MANDGINKLFLASIEKGLIKNEKELNVNFERKIILKKYFGETILFPYGYGKEHFINTLI